MNKMRSLLLGTVAVVWGTAAAYAAPPSGTWNINQNGTRGKLVLSFDGSNQLGYPSALDNTQIRGFWDETSQKLIFYRVINGGTGVPPTDLQVFTGYQFPGSLAGSFEAFATAGGSPSRNVFGWYATTP